MGRWQAQPFDETTPLMLDSCGHYTSMCLFYTSPVFISPYVLLKC